MAQIRTVTSEALEAQVRTLLPSQQGFGEDLQASNVIQPVIDLTRAAEGSQVPSYLQTALSFGSNTAYNVRNSSTNLSSTPGFYRVIGVANIEQIGNTRVVDFSISDGLSTKKIWEFSVPDSATADSFSAVTIDFVAFLRAGDTLSVTSAGLEARCAGSVRQIATVNGTLVNPVGFSPQ